MAEIPAALGPVAVHRALPFPWVPVILCALAVAFIAFSIWKLKQTAKGASKIFGITVIITVVAETFYFGLGSLFLGCTFGRCYDCFGAGTICNVPTKFDVFVSELPVTAPIIFGAALIIYYAVLLFKTRTKNINEK